MLTFRQEVSRGILVLIDYRRNNHRKENLGQRNQRLNYSGDVFLYSLCNTLKKFVSLITC